MRIAIVSSGRFHLLDLARELAALGHSVLFYSAVPPWQTSRFGLRPENTRWLGPVAAGLIWATRRYSGAHKDLAELYARRGIDRLAAHALEECDVVIGLSGLCIQTFKAAKQKFAAKVIVERGSLHIRTQKAVLDQVRSEGHAAKSVTEASVNREERSYVLADIISVPSRAAEASFVAHGFTQERLFRNPYGTSLELFQRTPTPPRPHRALMVGGWCVRKGCDILFKALLEMPGNVELWHVGSIVDLPMPSHPRFRHFDPVPQKELPKFYRDCAVFVLASREEGMAVVQMQALASGLPLVCTDATGGEDLAELLSASVYVARAGDVSSLRNSLQQAFDGVGDPGEERGPGNLEALSWGAYAQRYSTFLEQLFGKGSLR